MLDLSAALAESHESLIFSLGYASNTQKAVEYKRLRTERDQQLLSLFSELGFCFIDAMTIAALLSESGTPLSVAFHLSDSLPNGCCLEVNDDWEERLVIYLDYPYQGDYANKTRNMYLDVDELLYLDYLTIEAERSDDDARYIIGVDETTFGLMKKTLARFRRCNNFDDLRNDFDPEGWEE